MLLVALSVAFRHATETHLEFEVANKDEEKKRSWLFTERGLGFQTAGSGTRTRDFRVSSTALWPLDHAAQVLICVATRRHTYCSSTNQCLQTLTTEQKKKIRILRLVAFQARVKSLFKTYLEQCCLWSVVRWTSLHHIWQSPPPPPSILHDCIRPKCYILDSALHFSMLHVSNPNSQLQDHVEK